MTNAEMVSEVINDLRALNVDDRISKRYVLSKLRDKASLFIKRENDLLKLFKYSSLFTTIPCIKMLSADNRQCCDIVISRCKSFMRSELKFPDIYSWRNGLIIQSVMSIGGKEFKEITPRDYEKVLKREFQDKSKGYFWFEDGHLVVPDSEVELIEVTAYWENEFEAKKLSFCSDNTSTTKCINPLDSEFKCPAHLRNIVKEETMKNLFTFYKRNVVDELPDENTNNKTNSADLKP